MLKEGQQRQAKTVFSWNEERSKSIGVQGDRVV